MNFTDRVVAAWRALKGQRDPYAGTYGSGSSSGFAGGAVGRLTASLATWSGSVNADLDTSLPIMRARARALAANNEHGRRFLTLVATNVVGRQNPRLQVRAMRDQRDPNKPTTLDKAANDTVEAHWEKWGRTCDLSGRHKTLYSLLRTTLKGVARDGEAVIRIVRNRALPYGMALQLLEADRLDEGLNAILDNGNIIRQGVEIDSALRPVAYHLKTAHPGEAYATARAGVERVPVSEIYHLFTPERAEQVRGITWFHAVIIRGSTIHRYEEAAVIAAEIGASKIAALERSDDAPDVIGAGMADAVVGGLPQIKVEAGEMFELPPGYKLNSWNPDYPHANFESFLKACLRGLAAGLDVAAHNLTGDMNEVNYSSARIAELAERETWMVLQDWLITSFVQPLYEDWLALNLLSGNIRFEISGKAIPADRFEKFRSASRFQGRRWSWVDPAKEADANAKLLESGLTSRTRICAEQGEEFEDVLDELAQEKILMDAAGLVAVETPPPAADTTPEVVAAKAHAAATVRAAELHRDAAALMKPEPTPAIPPISLHMQQDEVTRELARSTAATVEAVQQLSREVADMKIIVNVPEQREQPAPQITFAPVTNVAAPEVTVEVEAIMPELSRVEITGLPIRKTTTEILRDQSGDIATSIQIESDA